MIKRILLYSYFFLLACAAGVWLFSNIKQDIIREKRVNILVLGISETDNARFAEVVNLVSYEPLTGFIDIIALPRDAKISVPHEVTWKRIQKLDEVYSRLYRKNKKDNIKTIIEFKKVVTEI